MRRRKKQSQMRVRGTWSILRRFLGGPRCINPFLRGTHKCQNSLSRRRGAQSNAAGRDSDLYGRRRGTFDAVILQEGYELDMNPAKTNSEKSRLSKEKRLAGCQKTHGELERAEALSNFNRAQRHVRWVRDDFCGGKSHFPEQKSLPCSFCARKYERFQQKLVRVVGRLKTLWVFRFRPWRNCRRLKSKI